MVRSNKTLKKKINKTINLLFSPPRLVGQLPEQEGFAGGREGVEEASGFPVLQGAHGAGIGTNGQGTRGHKDLGRCPQGVAYRRRRPPSHEHRIQRYAAK